MIKKIAITGHTSGLGKSFFDILSNNYNVVGYSKSNGYDLRDYSVVSKIIDEISDVDLFINNAKPDYAQAQIVYRLARTWSGMLLSIGSQALIDPPKWNDTFLLEYLTQKTALLHAHTVLEQISKCKLIIVHPDHISDADLCARSILAGIL